MIAAHVRPSCKLQSDKCEVPAGKGVEPISLALHSTLFSLRDEHCPMNGSTLILDAHVAKEPAGGNLAESGCRPGIDLTADAQKARKRHFHFALFTPINDHVTSPLLLWQRSQMTTDQPAEVSEFLDQPAVSPLPIDLERFRVGPWFYPTVLGGSVTLFLGTYVGASSPMGILAFVLVNCLTGLVMTLLATAWGAAVAFAESARSGIWFAVFPPFMVVFAARRWRWMAQPSVLFLTGLALAIVSLWETQRLAPPP